MNDTSTGWGWYTHIPMLYEALRLTKGPIVELGVGTGSTPLIHCLANVGIDDPPRDVYSLEDNEKWAHVQRSRYFKPWHQFIHVTDWRAQVQSLVDLKPGLVFVDNGCNANIHNYQDIRESMVEMFKDAGVVLLHDASTLFAYHITYKKRFAELFPIMVEDLHREPSTLWLSQTISPEFTMQRASSREGD